MTTPRNPYEGMTDEERDLADDLLAAELGWIEEGGSDLFWGETYDREPPGLP